MRSASPAALPGSSAASPIETDCAAARPEHRLRPHTAKSLVFIAPSQMWRSGMCLLRTTNQTSKNGSRLGKASRGNLVLNLHCCFFLVDWFLGQPLQLTVTWRSQRAEVRSLHILSIFCQAASFSLISANASKLIPPNSSSICFHRP